MSISYNLIDEPWIPCLFTDGTLRELGLRAALKAAPDIREIAHDSPLFVASIHPILTVILHRVLSGKSTRERKAAWDNWWKQGHFDEAAVDAYFKQWHDRFDLFDAKFPFYQVPSLKMDEAKELSILLVSETNNSTMFSLPSSSWVNVEPKIATQILITAQNYGATGKNSKAEIDGEDIGSIYSAYSVLTSALTLWPSGNNLFETLILNVVPHAIPEDDKPCWELETPHSLRDQITGSQPPTVQSPRGICDLLTIQSRSIRLLFKATPEGSVVTGAYITQGRRLIRDATGRPYFHPLSLYYPNKKEGFSALSLSENKAIWRNAHSLFQKEGQVSNALHPLSFIARQSVSGSLPSTFRPNLNVVGLCSAKPGKFLMWRFDRLPFSPAFLTDADLVETLKTANADADLVADEMRARFATVVRVFIAGDKDGGHKPDPDDVKALVGKFDPRRDYWPRLEAHFYELLHALIEHPGDTKPATDKWKNDLQTVARASLQTACGALGTSPQAISAVAQIDLGWPFNLDYLRDPKAYLAAKKLREKEHKAAPKPAFHSNNSASQKTLEFSFQNSKEVITND